MIAKIQWAPTVRVLLTAALLVGVYSETGPCTTLMLALVVAFSELTAAVVREELG